MTMKVFARTPLDLEELSIPHGKIYLIPSRCKGCNLCIELCPREVLRSSDNTNEKGYHLPEIIPGMKSACVHCEFCTMVCPEFAIFTLEDAG
jgi:2-oxoglutarate ferredoxin oxidoreductase subunit delta